MARDTRQGLGTVVSVALLTLITLLLAFTTFTVVVPSLGNPSEEVEYVTAESTLDAESQKLEVTKNHGSSVDVKNLEVRVRLPNGDEGRITDLPSPRNCLTNLRAKGAVDGSCGTVEGSLTSYRPDTDGTWHTGDSMVFRIQKGSSGSPGTDLSSGDEVDLSLTHLKSDRILIDKTVVAE
ncbi:MAG: hypothetical protein ABEK59_01030 [Halobacteria archaeon]